MQLPELPAVAPAPPEENHAAAKPRGEASAHDDFHRVMERTLKPQKKSSEKSSPSKTQATTGKNESPATEAKTSAAPNSCGGKISAAAPKNNANDAVQNSFIPELTPATDDQIPPPALLSLPLLGNFLATNQAVATPAVFQVTTDKDNFVQAVAAPMTDTKTKSLVNELATPVKNLPTGSPRSSFLVALVPEVQSATPAAGLEISAKDFVAVKNAPEITATAGDAEPKLEISNRAPVEFSAADEKIKIAVPAEISATQNAGTGVATDVGQMKKTENGNKVAGLDEQVLPGGTNGTAREAVTSSHPSVAQTRVVENKNSDFNLPLPALTAPVADRSSSTNVIALPSLADTRMRDVERTQDMVSLHALRMVETKADSVSVVIRPGAGTELSLELRHRNGVVEAAAVLQRGDFQLMNQHWPELQQKLEQRGIKLSALGGEGNFSAADNGSFSRQQQASREEAAQQASAFAEFTMAMNRGGATARLAPVAPDGWESWA
jgi:hypothetical protein